MEIWQDNEGDHLEVQERAGEIYGRGNRFDFTAKNWAEARAKLTGWGYRLVGAE